MAGGMTIYPFESLRDSGILGLINREVFHPRGYALALVVDDESHKAIGWTLVGNGSMVFGFEEWENEEINEAVDAFLSQRGE